MTNETTQPAPKKSKATRRDLAIVVLLVVVALVVVVAVIGSNPKLPSEQTTQTTQVQVEVEYSGSWSGAYGDESGIVSWSGQGSKTIILNKPSDTSIWIISANAQKGDDSENSLTIRIQKMDGTVLREATTTASYGVASVSCSIQD